MRIDLNKSGGFIGLAGIAVMAFLYVAAWFAVPAWAAALLSVVWLLHVAVGCRWFTSHPRRVFWLPVTLAAVWFAGMWAGARFLDWGA